TTQEIEFALAFSGQVVCGEVCGDVWISFRIPNVVVDSVCDTRKAILACAQQPVEAMTLIRHLNLARITRTNRRQSIGRDDSRFQRRRCCAQYEVVTVWRIAKTQPPKVFWIEESLVSNIVK